MLNQSDIEHFSEQLYTAPGNSAARNQAEETLNRCFPLANDISPSSSPASVPAHSQALQSALEILTASQSVYCQLYMIGYLKEMFKRKPLSTSTEFRCSVCTPICMITMVSAYRLCSQSSVLEYRQVANSSSCPNNVGWAASVYSFQNRDGKYRAQNAGPLEVDLPGTF